MFDKRKDQTSPASVPPQREPAPPAETRTPPQSSSAATGVIGAGLAFGGELSGSEDVVVAGRFEGKVTLPENTLSISQGGHVKAEVSAKVVEIEGQVQGDVQGAEKVVITATGKMEGTITSPRVILADGAKFKGSIDMDPPQPAKEPAPKPAQGAQQQERPRPTAAPTAQAAARA